jgi:hypothetical protein
MAETANAFRPVKAAREILKVDARITSACSRRRPAAIMTDAAAEADRSAASRCAQEMMEG